MSNPVDTDNLDMLKELIGDDLKEILQAYLDSAPDSVIKMDNALHAGDADQLRLHSHSLKGSSANIGAGPLSQICAQLEDMAKNNDISAQSNTLFQNIKNENTQVMQLLQNYIQQI